MDFGLFLLSISKIPLYEPRISVILYLDIYINIEVYK